MVYLLIPGVLPVTPSSAIYNVLPSGLNENPYALPELGELSSVVVWQHVVGIFVPSDNTPRLVPDADVKYVCPLNISTTRVLIKAAVSMVLVFKSDVPFAGPPAK